MLYLSSLVDMSEAVDTDIMTSTLASCPVDACSGRKKSLFLSTWFLENSVHGGCGDPTPATKEFGELIFSMIVDKMTAIITEFYDIQEKMSERKLKRKCTTF